MWTVPDTKSGQDSNQRLFEKKSSNNIGTIFILKYVFIYFRYHVIHYQG